MRRLLLDGDAGAGEPGRSAEGRWDAVYGDRAQELVFIGCGMDQGAVRSALEGALLTDDEFALGPEEWDGWDDPFDFFEYEDDGEEGEEGEGEGELEPEVGHAHVHTAACAHGHHHAHAAEGDGGGGAVGLPRRIVTKDGKVELVGDSGAEGRS